MEIRAIVTVNCVCGFFFFKFCRTTVISILEPWSSKCVPWTNDIGFTGVFVRNAESWVPPQTYWIWICILNKVPQVIHMNIYIFFFGIFEFYFIYFFIQQVLIHLRLRSSVLRNHFIGWKGGWSLWVQGPWSLWFLQEAVLCGAAWTFQSLTSGTGGGKGLSLSCAHMGRSTDSVPHRQGQTGAAWGLGLGLAKQAQMESSQDQAGAGWGRR